MIIIPVDVKVKGLSAKDAMMFLIDCNDEMYSKSWPGVHIQKHRTKQGGPDHIGDVVYAFEHVGKGSLEVTMEVTKFTPYSYLEFRCKAGWIGSLIPIIFYAEAEELPGDILHFKNTFKVGWNGIGKIFDPIIRLNFSEEFLAALHHHVSIEWQMISDSLKN